MKKRKLIIKTRSFLTPLLTAACAATVAQAATSSPADPTLAGGLASANGWSLVIPAVVPVVIAGVKWALPKVPSVWLPVLAPVLGAGLEVVLHYAGLTSGNGLVGAMLGSAGVGLREVIDQVRKLQGQTEGSR